MNIFPIITKEIQRSFETTCKSTPQGISLEELPMICGCYGRACRQMGKEEGANRMNCTGCPLAEYAKERQEIA